VPASEVLGCTEVEESTKIIRKYRCKAAAKRMFGPKWKKYLSITEREKAERKRKSKQQLLKEKVVSFMEREDNSTVMPGKKDCSAGKIKIQKFHLTILLRTESQCFNFSVSLQIWSASI
jgi:hypothetical protein